MAEAKAEAQTTEGGSMTVRIILGDAMEQLRNLPDKSVDSCVTDPPYHLTTGKKGGSGPASVNLESPYGRARVTTGFMGMKWDGGDIAHNPQLWAEVLRVLKPGAYLLAFGGTRTYHRLACAIEDAGFEIRDMIGWLYGSGFPKGTDKAKIPAAWKGWNTALKPALEPLCFARKPMEGTLAQNLEKWGTGAIWVDGCRIEIDDSVDDPRLGGKGDWSSDKMAKNVYEGGSPGVRVGSSELGRWPANLIHDGSEEVLACFPTEAGAAAPVHKRSGDEFRHTFGAFSGNIDEAGSTFQGDSGSAARFFYCAKASRQDRNEGLHGMATKALNWSSGEQSPGTFQSPNTNRQAQNHHPTVKPTDLMRYLCRLVTPKGGTVLDPFMGSGSTGRGAIREGFNFIGIELDEQYIEIARLRIHADAPLFAEEG